MSASDPYAAPPRRTPPPLTLPHARFRRLGASPRAVAALDAWWQTAPPHSRRVIVDRIAELTDTEAAVWLQGAEVPDGTATAIVDWASSQRDPRFSATLAALVEEQAERPRTSLVARLRKVG